MATPRTTIKNVLKSDNAAFLVDAFPTLPDHLGKGKVHVSVYRTDIKTTANANVLEHNIDIQIVVPLTSGEVAEAAADDALDAVLLSLQHIEGVSWSIGERMSFDDAFIGYKISASLMSSNVYRTAILESN